MYMNGMWDTRTKASKSLELELKKEADAVYKTFIILDKLLDIYSTNDTDFCRVIGIIIIKGRNLAKGCFSLSMDGLAQEAGALLRPLIECLELLQYLYEDSTRIGEVLDGKLPSAGKIAIKINGKYKKLRDYLNVHASHISFSYESMAHLVDIGSGQWKVSQPFNIKVLRTNMSTTNALVTQLSFLAANCLALKNSLSEALEKELNICRDNGRSVFIGGPIP
jgi:hypothetical protein